jgi:acetyl-CoA C-acetyltransferase
MAVASGAADLVIAGGAESMSRVEHYGLLRQGVRGTGIEFVDRLSRARETAGGRFHPIRGGMIQTAENLRRDYGLTREAQDVYALRSHRKAAWAQAHGRFAAETVPVELTGRRGATTVVDADEQVRPGTTIEALGARCARSCLGRTRRPRSPRATRPARTMPRLPAS